MTEEELQDVSHAIERIAAFVTRIRRCRRAIPVTDLREELDMLAHALEHGEHALRDHLARRSMENLREFTSQGIDATVCTLTALQNLRVLLAGLPGGRAANDPQEPGALDDGT